MRTGADFVDVTRALVATNAPPRDALAIAARRLSRDRTVARTASVANACISHPSIACAACIARDASSEKLFVVRTNRSRRAAARASLRGQARERRATPPKTATVSTNKSLPARIRRAIEETKSPVPRGSRNRPCDSDRSDIATGGRARRRAHSVWDVHRAGPALIRTRRITATRIANPALTNRAGIRYEVCVILIEVPKKPITALLIDEYERRILIKSGRCFVCRRDVHAVHRGALFSGSPSPGCFLRCSAHGVEIASNRAAETIDLFVEPRKRRIATRIWIRGRRQYVTTATKCVFDARSGRRIRRLRNQRLIHLRAHEKQKRVELVIRGRVRNRSRRAHAVRCISRQKARVAIRRLRQK